MVNSKLGPVTIPLSLEAKETLMKWKDAEYLTYEDMAQKIKIGTQVLGGLLRGERGAKRETHMRVMRFVRRLQKKGIRGETPA